MRKLRNQLIIVVSLAALAAIWWGIERWQYRFVHEDRDLIALLPNGPGSTFFVDVEAIKQVGLLEPVRLESEYSSFLNDIGLDPMRDLKAITGIVGGTVPVFAVRGRLDWSRIEKYTRSQGGTCSHNACQVSIGPTKQNLRIERVQPDVLLMSSGTVPVPKAHLRTKESWWSSPVWVDLDPAALSIPASSPAPLRLFGLVMSPSRAIVFDVDDTGASLLLRMQAEFENHAAAETARAQLDLQTKMMQLEIAREHKTANKADLTGLITAGAFDVSGRKLTGNWPIRTELLQSLR